MRAGIGFDVHAFDTSRPLILGGVTIPNAPGLAGHSDADVLCHAVADALLGAANLGDLGEHFPDSDAAWKGTSSLDILEHVVDDGRRRRVRRVVGRRDGASREAEARAASRRDARDGSRQRSALPTSIVSVKASTTEGLGTVGRGEGAACMADRAPSYR